MDNIVAQMLVHLKERLRRELIPDTSRAAAHPAEYTSERLFEAAGRAQRGDAQGERDVHAAVGEQQHRPGVAGEGRSPAGPELLGDMIVNRYFPIALRGEGEPEAALALRFALRKLSTEIRRELVADKSIEYIARKYHIAEDSAMELAGASRAARNLAHKYGLAGDKAMELMEIHELRRNIAQLAVADEMEKMLGTQATWVSFLDSDRTLVHWAKNTERPLPKLDRHARINCWDALLIAGVRSGRLSHANVHGFYTGLGFYAGLGELATDVRKEGAWLRGLPRRLIGGPMPYPVSGFDPVKVQKYAEELGTSSDELVAMLTLQRGDLFVWNSSDHAAMFTGNFVGIGKDRSPEVYTFWPPPGPHNPDATGSWARVDRIKTSTVKELTDYIVDPPSDTVLKKLPVRVIWHGRGPW